MPLATTGDKPDGQARFNHGATNRAVSQRLPGAANGPRAPIGGRRSEWQHAIITLHGALSPAEKDLARSPEGAAQVQEFHRQLFANASDSIRQEIKKITGVEVREATTEVAATTGAVVQVFTTGTMVQVYLLSHSVPGDTWTGNERDDQP